MADTLSSKNKETAGNSVDEERAGAGSVRTAHYQMAHQDSAVILDRKVDVLLVWSKLSEDPLSGIGHFIDDLLAFSERFWGPAWFIPVLSLEIDENMVYKLYNIMNMKFIKRLILSILFFSFSIFSNKIHCGFVVVWIDII